MRERDRIALIGCALTLAFCGAAFGGAVRWTAITTAIGGIATAAVFVGSRRQAIKHSPLMLLLAVAIGLTLLQLLPMPSAIASGLFGAKVDLVDANARALGESAPSFVAASYDPPATLLELAKLCGYAAIAFAASRLAMNRRSRRTLAIIVVGAALLVSAIALGHAIFGIHEIYGIYPSPALPRLVGPIVNDNHFAAITALAVPLAIGLALTTTGLARLAWFGAALACVAVTLVISSRGGAIGLLVGALLTGALLVAQRGSTEERRSAPNARRSSIVRAIVAVCLMLIVAAPTANNVASKLAATDMDEVREPHSKFQVWVRSLDMLEENRWFGVGHGAFEPAFRPWSDVGDQAYSHAENSYLQMALDWGLPGAAALVVAASVVILAAARRWRQGALEAGALGALLSVAVHDLADFSIELPLVALMVILTTAILLPTRIESTASEGRPRPVEPRIRWLRSGLLAAAVLVCVVSASPLGRLAHAEANADNASDALERALAANARHPADFMFLGRAGKAMMDLGDRRAAAVISRALSLDPRHAGMHDLAAQLLIESGRPAQAKIEYAAALQYATPMYMYSVIDHIAAKFPDGEDAAGALPIDLAYVPRIVVALRGRGLAQVELAYARRLARLYPDDDATQLELADIAILLGRDDVALEAASAAYRIHADAKATIELARARAIAGDRPGGIAILRKATAERDGVDRANRVALLEALADLELAAGELEALGGTLSQLAEQQTDAAGQIAVHKRRAELEERIGNKNQAAWEREQIRQLEGGVRPW